ncbi:MAG: DUF2974 domain-containing protein [Lachnospiraceae bacterium]|nr:DUF2974 domain-containing protein [Lachnospiraceae bacterium]
MGNIVDYIKEYGGDDFNKRRFCKEDALVLSQFAYLKFEGILDVMSREPVALEDIDSSKIRDSLFSDYRYEKDNRALYEAMLSSVRFAGLKIAMYINRIEEDTQFAALTFLLPGHTLIVFRGTDETIVGWQEDMGLALKKNIKGQDLSVKYLNDAAGSISGKFMVAGHSKGGNLAIFSAMFASPEIQKRIKKIYCFDSPGFRAKFLRKSGYDEIKERVVKVIPKSSFVGMLFDDGGDSIVVDAKSVGVIQHNPYMWTVKKGKLVKTKLSNGHKRLIATVNEWILSKDEEQLERFVFYLNKLLESSDADNTIDFSKELIRNSKQVIRAAKGLDDDTKEFLSAFLRSYVEIAKGMIKEEVKERAGKKKKEA